MDDATTPDIPLATGRVARRINDLPRPRVVEQSLHAKSAAPLQKSAGAINVNVLIEIVGTPSGARTTA
jgi:hypothetical protein